MALALLAPTTAFAHNVVEDRDPAPDSVVTLSPLTVSLGTNDEFLNAGGNTRGFVLLAQDAGGLYYGDGCVELLEHTMSATLALGEAGTYAILSQFVSGDGHSVQESYTIVFAPYAGHTPAPGSSEPPVCGQSVASTPTPQDTTTDAGQSAVVALTEDAGTTVSIIPSIAGIIVLIVVIGGFAVAALRKKSAHG
jgi:hypothetical protein